MCVIRLFLAFFSALTLALSPVATASAAAAPMARADCEKMGDLPVTPADQPNMDCCGPACPAPAPAAVEPERAGSANDVSQNGFNPITPVKALYSLASTGLDPPPRLLS